jgi:hypothetical protein
MVPWLGDSIAHDKSRVGVPPHCLCTCSVSLVAQYVPFHLSSNRGCDHNYAVTCTALNVTSRHKPTTKIRRGHHHMYCKGKGKAIPLQAWTGPKVSRRMRLPDFKTIGTWKWKGCQPCAPTAFTPRKHSCTHFC